MALAHALRELVDEGEMRAFEPRVACVVRATDAFVNRGQVILSLYELVMLLMRPIGNNVPHLGQEHIKIALIRELDLHGLLNLSKLQAQHVVSFSIHSSHYLAQAAQEETFLGGGLCHVVVFSSVYCARPVSGILNALLQDNLVSSPVPTSEETVSLDENAEIDVLNLLKHSSAALSTLWLDSAFTRNKVVT